MSSSTSSRLQATNVDMTKQAPKITTQQRQARGHRTETTHERAMERLQQHNSHLTKAQRETATQQRQTPERHHGNVYRRAADTVLS